MTETMTDAKDLLAAVDALTKRTRTRVVQPVYKTIIGDDGRPKLDASGNPRRKLNGTQVTKLEHPPLLAQLEDAIRGAMGTTEGSSASMKFTRGMINSEALMQFTRIRSMITDWARTVGVPRTDDAVVELRRWYVAWTATPRDEAKTRWHTRKLESWATIIEETIDPWKPRPIEGPCPMPDCPQEEIDGLWFYWDARLRERGNRPLLVEYRPAEKNERIEEWSRAKCRACGTVWASVRALQWDREHAGETVSEQIPENADTPTA